MIELEKTYLAKSLPQGLKDCRRKEIADSYIPKESDHCVLRVRKSGDELEITKKAPTRPGDASQQEEQTIQLSQDEYNALASIPGKKVRKIRYYYDHHGKIAEFDVFQDELEGLVAVDVEFETEEEKQSFGMPDFCLADVTQEDFIAGGMISGKSYADIEGELDRFGYKKLFL